MKRSWISFATLACLATAPALVAAQSAPMPPPLQPAPQPEESVTKYFGVGYKIGNGLGFLGADLVITPIDHLTLDLQANWYSASANGDSATGYGVAPALQYHFRPGWGSSAYIGAGFLYAKMTLGGVSASAQGGFLNAGYEWRWASGLGVMVGGGIGHLGQISVTDGATTVKNGGGTLPMIEAGVRYMFL
jgi:hypothetical protein